MSEALYTLELCLLYIEWDTSISIPWSLGDPGRTGPHPGFAPTCSILRLLRHPLLCCSSRSCLCIRVFEQYLRCLGTEKLGKDLRAQGELTLMLGSAVFAILPAAVELSYESSPPQTETRGHGPPGDVGSQGWQAWRREAESPHRVRSLEQGLIVLGPQVR